jgi:hypothetical protein
MKTSGKVASYQTVCSKPASAAACAVADYCSYNTSQTYRARQVRSTMWPYDAPIAVKYWIERFSAIGHSQLHPPCTVQGKESLHNELTRPVI